MLEEKTSVILGSEYVIVSEYIRGCLGIHIYFNDDAVFSESLTSLLDKVGTLYIIVLEYYAFSTCIKCLFDVLKTLNTGTYHNRDIHASYHFLDYGKQRLHLLL